MRVTVDFNHQEFELYFQQDAASSNGSGELWVGSLPDKSSDKVWVRFYTKDGLVTNLEVSPEITTHQAVLTERIEEALMQYRESRASEIEPDDDEYEISDPTPYDPRRIKIRRDIYSVREIFEMMEEDRAIDLNPEFQRYFVWNNTQQSQLVESLLLGLPIPLFYFAENVDRTFNVVDGLQRLTTLHRYMRNEFPLKGLEHLGDEYNGKYFKPDASKGISIEKSLPRPMSRLIEKTQFVVNVIEASSPVQVKFDIFKRINTGGKHLNNQEIRNCVATPNTRRLLREMVHTDLFRQTTGGTDLAKRMDDQELAMRFIGFRLVRRSQLEYNGNMTNFLNSLVDTLNGIKEKDLQPLVNAFNIALCNCQHLFGKYAFRKCLPEHLEPGARPQAFNKSLFTTWMVVLSDRDVRDEAEAGGFAYIQAQELAAKGAFYENVTSKTNDKAIIAKVFEKVESIALTHLSNLQSV